MPEDRQTFSYTAEQAEALLAYAEVKLPGFLRVAEDTLRKADMWPADRAEATP